MTSNVINAMPFLRTSREFPEEIHELAVQCNKSFVDIANVVNDRIIGLFPVNRPAITGERFYLNGPIQQTLRQVYIFTTTVAINHGITNVVPGQFTKCSGSFTDGTNTYGLFFASSVAIAGQITFYVTATQIVFLSGAGAPALQSGRVILEWLSAP